MLMEKLDRCQDTFLTDVKREVIMDHVTSSIAPVTHHIFYSLNTKRKREHEWVKRKPSKGSLM